MQPKEPTPEETKIVNDALAVASKALWKTIAEVGEPLEEKYPGGALPVVVSTLLMIAADLLHEDGKSVQFGELILRQAYAKAVTGELFGDEEDEDEDPHVHFVDGPTTMQ